MAGNVFFFARSPEAPSRMTERQPPATVLACGESSSNWRVTNGTTGDPSSPAAANGGATVVSAVGGLIVMLRLDTQVCVVCVHCCYVAGTNVTTAEKSGYMIQAAQPPSVAETGFKNPACCTMNSWHTQNSFHQYQHKKLFCNKYVIWQRTFYHCNPCSFVHNRIHKTTPRVHPIGTTPQKGKFTQFLAGWEYAS